MALVKRTFWLFQRTFLPYSSPLELQDMSPQRFVQHTVLQFSA